MVALSVRRPAEIANCNTTKDDSAPPSFHDWVRGDFDIEDGRLSSADAAIIILLPIAVVAIGMMTFGIEFQIVEHAGVYRMRSLIVAASCSRDSLASAIDATTIVGPDQIVLPTTVANA